MNNADKCSLLSGSWLSQGNLNKFPPVFLVLIPTQNLSQSICSCRTSLSFSLSNNHTERFSLWTDYTLADPNEWKPLGDTTKCIFEVHLFNGAHPGRVSQGLFILISYTIKPSFILDLKRIPQTLISPFPEVCRDGNRTGLSKALENSSNLFNPWETEWMWSQMWAVWPVVGTMPCKTELYLNNCPGGDNKVPLVWNFSRNSGEFRQKYTLHRNKKTTSWLNADIRRWDILSHTIHRDKDMRVRNERCNCYDQVLTFQCS